MAGATRLGARGRIEAGVAAGCRTILVEHPDSAHRRSGDTQADWHAADLAGAVRAILALP